MKRVIEHIRLKGEFWIKRNATAVHIDGYEAGIVYKWGDEWCAMAMNIKSRHSNKSDALDAVVNRYEKRSEA